MIYENILQTIGRTPIVRIQKLSPAHATIYVKCEFFNPSSSVKDRLAIAVIEDAEQRGLLRPGMTVIEPTSGNTGIGLAMVCAVKGYRFVAVMSEVFSVERRKVMRAFGARVILSPASAGGKGMVELAERLAKTNGWFLPQQFINPANPAYHRNTTGPEILSDFAGRKLDYFVSGMGTGGTISGTSAMLKQARPGLRVVMAEPANAPLISEGKWAPHKIEGMTPDFVPPVFERSIVDEIMTITDDEARTAARALASEEGIFCGMSAGASFAAAQRLAAKAAAGSVILAMLPDTAERYLSTSLFDDIPSGQDPDYV